MRALIIKNLQNDFMPSGAIPLPEAESILQKVNEAMLRYDVTIAIQKTYPADHPMFAANHPWRKPDQEIEVDGKKLTLQIMHCVEGTLGAAFPKDLEEDLIQFIIKDKGDGPEVVLAAIKEIVAKNKVDTIEVMGPDQDAA